MFLSRFVTYMRIFNQLKQVIALAYVPNHRPKWVAWYDTWRRYKCAYLCLTPPLTDSSGDLKATSQLFLSGFVTCLLIFNEMKRVIEPAYASNQRRKWVL